jgi:hypothetical protein
MWVLGVLSLGLLVTAPSAASVSTAGSQPLPTPSSPSLARIDHLLLGVPDLERATAEVETLTGVRAVYGGKHPTGTHNALLSLGDGAYLELIALQPGEHSDRYGDLEGLTRPTPVGWAVAGDDAGALRARLEQGGFAPSPARPGSRVTPQGKTLSWETFGIGPALEQAPFFIVWSKDTVHPSTSSPGGCRLARFTLRGPQAAELERLRGALALPVTIESAATAAMIFELDCPKGQVVFRSGS